MIFGNEIPVYEQRVEGNYIKRMMNIKDGEYTLGKATFVSYSSKNYSMPENVREYYPTGFILRNYGYDNYALFICDKENLVQSSKDTGSDAEKLQDLFEKMQIIERTAVPIKFNKARYPRQIVPAEGEQLPFNITQDIYKNAIKTAPLRIDYDTNSAISTLIYGDRAIFSISTYASFAHGILDTYKAYKALSLLRDNEVLCSVGRRGDSEKLLVAASIYGEDIALDVIGPVNNSVYERIKAAMGGDKIVDFELDSFTSSLFYINYANGQPIEFDSHLDNIGSLTDMEHIIRSELKKHTEAMKDDIPKRIKEKIENIKKAESKVDDLGLLNELLPTFQENSELKIISKYLIDHTAENMR